MRILTEVNFGEEVKQSKVPVLVDFWAPWCPPCNALTPVMEKIAEEFNGRAIVAKVNVAEQIDLAAKYNISSIPALLFFKNGKVVNTILGIQTEDVLRQELESLL